MDNAADWADATGEKLREAHIGDKLATAGSALAKGTKTAGHFVYSKTKTAATTIYDKSKELIVLPFAYYLQEHPRVQTLVTSTKAKITQAGSVIADVRSCLFHSLGRNHRHGNHQWQ